ncbi:MAG: hypothetical protein Q8T08_02965, partial [Ignavibacteria bacterium]|nr:hypothetical protein [Ignavibacteria bacterium]
PINADINPLESPLIISPDDLSEIVQALGNQLVTIKTQFDSYPVPRTPYEKKNKVNRMSDGYAKELRNKYLKETTQIQKFLASPENSGLLQLYESIIDEFQLKILSKRTDFQKFDDVMEYIADLLIGRDAILRSKKRLTRAMLFYMYWNCDIGEVEDVTTY